MYMKMRRIRLGLLGLAALFLTGVFNSCGNQLLPEPRMARSVSEEGDPSTQNPWGAPRNITASQGKKRVISLAWDPVDGAVRYNIYKSESPLLEFSLAGQSSDNAPRFEVLSLPGASLYFQVEAVDFQNHVSPRSLYVYGASLAQPVISDVISENGITGVYWYMNNVEAYREQIRYTVTCFESNTNTVKSRQTLGGGPEDTFAAFGGLASNTGYSFQVKAYRAENEDDAEYSEIVDALTARITRPGAPLNLEALQGGSTDRIVVSFELPGAVYVSTGGNQYEEHPLYFEIRRRKAGTSGPFQVICPYFGSDPDRAGADPSAAVFSGYNPGSPVSWVDASIPGVNRGLEYEYQVQSYVDGVDRKITSKDSIAGPVSGWTMLKASVAFETSGPVYQEDESGSRIGAVLSLDFEHETRGVDYSYRLFEHILPLGDGGDNGFSGAENSYDKTLEGVNNYQAEINLRAPGSASNKGRGIYSYSVGVYRGENLVETVYTVESRRVTEDKTAPVVEGFRVKDGYPDKFVVQWQRRGDRSYILEYADAANTTAWTEIGGGFGLDSAYPNTGEGAAPVFEYACYPAQPGESLYFRISAKSGAAGGEYFYSPEVQNLGVPVISAGPLGYGRVSLLWAPVPKADAYRITYVYAEQPGVSCEPVTVELPDLSLDSSGRYMYGFQPQGYDDARRAGKTLGVKLEALNAARGGEDGVPVKTVSDAIEARVFGPAELQIISITQDTSPSEISLSWQGFTGAAGYYVVRRQYKMDLSGPRTGEEVFYYINAATLALRIKNLNNGNEDSADVSAGISRDNGIYTLSDYYMTDAAYALRKQSHGFYGDEQNEMVWGYPYCYYVLPVLSENDKPAFNYGAHTCTLGDVTYTNSIDTLKETGRLFGFGEKVRATKGSAITEINGEDLNDRIELNWEEPGRFRDGKTKYYLYRKLRDSPGEWTLLTPSPIDETNYVDGFSGLIPPQAGLSYEYCVGITRTGGAGSSRPEQNTRFLEECRKTMDEEFPGEPQMTGHILGNSTLVSVSRDLRGDEDSGYYETITWNCAGVDNNSYPQKNRGITGYEIQVKNNDDGGAWKTFKRVNADPENLSYTENLDNSGGLLKILRDYRHYFRVRTYYENEGGRIYSVPPPEPNYSAGAENYWVRWGARQMSKNEFALATSLATGSALQGITQGGNDPNGCNTARNLSPVTPLFPNIGGALYAASSRKLSVLDLGYVPDKIEKYGAEKYMGGILNLSFLERAKPFTLSFTGALAMYTGTVTINNLGSDGNSAAYAMTFNGVENFTLDKTFFLKPFTFGEEVFKDCNSLDGNGTAGWL
jgi:hypothetical protein